jgi:protein-tyrosine kinase
MVDTRRLEKLMSHAPPAPAGEAALARRSLALSGHRELRRAGQTRGRSAQRQSVIEANWQALPRGVPDQDHDRETRQFNALAHDRDVMSRFDLLRTQLVQNFRQRNLITLGISAPAAGAGASFVAAGLISALARRGGLRGIGLDLNPAAPALQRYFELAPAASVLDLLRGDAAPEACLQRLTDTVALGFGQAGAELPGGWGFSVDDLAETLAELTDHYAPDMIICDLPPLLQGDLALSMCSQLDAVLLIADSRRTRAEEMLACERLLSGQTEFLGVILNNYSGSEQI